MLYLLAAIFVLSTFGYMVLMCEAWTSPTDPWFALYPVCPSWTLRLPVYALYFTIQTMTTVGYGSWQPPGVKDEDERVFWVKVLSLFVMAGSAALFTAAVNVVVRVVVDVARE